MVLLYGVESGTVPEKFESGQKPMVIALIIVGKRTTTAIYKEGVLGQQMLVLSSTFDDETK